MDWTFCFAGQHAKLLSIRNVGETKRWQDAVRDYLIEVKFNDGTQKVIDFEPWLTGPIFKPLKSKHYFKKFFIDGPTIAWPNGADIAPETLYEAMTIKTDSNWKLRRSG